MTFDLGRVGFSRFGSYMTFGFLPPAWRFPGRIFRTMHLADGPSRELMRVDVVAGGTVAEPATRAEPAVLRLSRGAGRVEVCFAEPDVVRFRGSGLGLRLSSLNRQHWRVVPLGGGRWQLNPPAYRMQYLLTVLGGRLRINAARHEAGHRDPRTLRRPGPPVPLRIEIEPGENGIFEAAVEELRSTPTGAGVERPFDRCVQQVAAEWERWLAGMPAVAARYRQAAGLAMYVNWAAVVGAAGLNRRPTMLMSKNYMNQCWSWDHCFTAMALAGHDPALAWDQMLAPFDHQDEFGCLPDAVMSTMTTWTAVKPPIHGWALSRMARTPGVLTPARAKTFYPLLAKWTEWWLRHRDTDGDGLPEYFNGADSGWDNATVFDDGCPVAAPDLAAYLVLQMDMLAELAAILGKKRAAAAWKRRADVLMQRMLDRLWHGGQFVSLNVRRGRPARRGDCLLNQMPVILGERLPLPYREAVAAALRPGGRFVTRHGPATESPASPCHNPAGYWRGPVWAPVTMMIVDGLRRGGHFSQAARVSRAFLDLCARSGFAENFNPGTGEPLCDQAYTWTSSAFLCLAAAGDAGAERRGRRPPA